MPPRAVGISTIGAAVDMERLTRTVFGNVPDWSKAVFYLLAAMAVVAFGIGCFKRAQLWRIGQPNGEAIPRRLMFVRFIRGVILQRGVRGRRLVSIAHGLLFSGFVTLLIATILIAIEHILAAALGREAANPVFSSGRLLCGL